MLLTDPNPIVDEGAPSSTGGIINAATLCDLLGIQLVLETPREHYEHGWGEDCHDARPIVASWTLTIMDIHSHPVSLSFDLVRGESPLIIGLDVMQYANVLNTKRPRHINIQRPGDVRSLSLHTYITQEEALGGTKRLRVEIAPHATSTVATLMSNINLLGKRTPLAFSKKIHRFTHAPPDEIKCICKNAGILNKELSNAIDKVDAACEVCARNGRPAYIRKVSLTYVNAAFNQELQIDFTHCDIGGVRYTLLNMTDRGTSWSEMRIVQNQNMKTMKICVEQDWICVHGAPNAVSGDDAYDKAEFRGFLKQHHIAYKPRPARRHNKLGSVERKNGTIKAIIRKLDSDLTDADAETIVARAVFLSNLFSGSRKLSSFQLVKGYTPSVLGIPSSRVTPELLQAHKEQTATRAIHTLLHSNNPNVVPSDVLKEGDPIWVYYETTSNSKKKGWVRATVVEAQQHRVLARRSTKGPPLRVAYEDVRPAPMSQLTQELMSRSLEDELETANNTEDMSNLPRDVDSSDRGVIEETRMPTEGVSDLHISPALMAQKQSTTEENPMADIGKEKPANHPPPNAKLESDRKRVMKKISNTIGKNQVNHGRLEFAPSWVVREAFDKEHGSNWANAYEQVDEAEVPTKANVIPSHVVYKVKTSEDGSQVLKARIVPNGNRDSEKDDVRKDSSTAQFDVIRLLLAVTTFLGMRLAMADVKGAYLQSGPIRREIYVRPPREWKGQRGTLWRLTKLPYGIVEAGRQWAKTVEEWMLTEGGLQRLHGLNQLYVRRNGLGTIILIVAKVTDDFICGGALHLVTAFVRELGKRFEVGKVIIDGKFLFNGCEIEQDERGSVRMSMNGYMSQLQEIPLSKERKRQPDEAATEREVTQFRSLAGTLLWLGKGVLPPAAYASSTMQQKLAFLKVGHLVEANDIVRDIKKLTPHIIFPRSTSVVRAMISTFSDASFNISSRKSYGQTGLVLGIRTQLEDGSELFHVLDWVSVKQRRICHSSYGAEILACAEGDDRGFYLKMGMRSLFPKTNIRNEIVIDSMGLYDTITTLHEGNEYRLRQTVQRIRDSFEAGDVNIIRWIPGVDNIADALTKRNITLWKKLNEICITGRLDPSLLRGQSLDSAQWK